MHPNTHPNATQSIYLTQHELERKLQQKESTHDLFDFLLTEENHCMHRKSCQTHSQIESTSPNMDIQGDEQHERNHGCRCSKIQCLKLYCECFANNRKCGGKCQCSSCRNCPDNQSEIYHAKMITNYRHPGHFKGVPALIPNRKCTCKKSMCQKRYCQCYNAGLKCTEFCDCKDCQNGHPHSHDDSEYYQIFNDYRNTMEIQVPA